MYKNIGTYKNLGVDKLLVSTKHWCMKSYVSAEHRPPRNIGVRQCLAQEKVGGDAEELSYC
jgi:hypothetical protein